MFEGTIKTRVAGGAITYNRFVKNSATPTQVLQASSPSDYLAGVCVTPGISAAGDRVDVSTEPHQWVEAGAAISAGAPITTDSLGRAVTAAPGAGINVRIVGFAFDDVFGAGEFVRVTYAPSIMQG